MNEKQSAEARLTPAEQSLTELWEKHLGEEFATRDTEATLETMVADAYVNLTSDRTFAPPKTDEQAIAELGKLSGTRFDGMIVRLFARLLKMERATSFGGASER